VRAEGVGRIETLAFASGLSPRADVADGRRLAALLRGADVVHVHRGKEHWLAVAAARVSGRRVPIVRTRHIVQPVRPHPGNRWLYGRATALVVAVTDAIRRQCLAAGLLAPDRVVTLRGGADVEAYCPRPGEPAVRRRLGAEDGTPLVGLVWPRAGCGRGSCSWGAGRRKRASGPRSRAPASRTASRWPASSRISRP
jgi:hypothetical protein